MHALTGCDIVPVTFNIGKPTAVKAAKKHTFHKLGHVNASVPEIIQESKDFMVTCHGTKPSTSMTECRQKQWATKTGNAKTAAPKLCSLPPTTEAFHQNALRAHFQVSHWLAALDIDPPELDPLEHGFVADHINKVLNPRPLAEGVKPAPDFILKLIKCNCASEQACKGGNCGCTSRLTPCTMFCACCGGVLCNNPFKKKHAVEEDSDSEDEVDND